MTQIVRHKIKQDVVAGLLRGETYSQLADRLSEKFGIPVSRSTIAGIARDVKANKLDLGAVEPAPSFSRPKTYRYGVEDDNGGLPVFNGHPELEADRLLVISDLHLPYTCYKFVENLRKIAKRHKIKRMLIAGDLIDGDSRHHKHRVRRASMSEQLAYSRDAVAFFLSFIDEIFVLPGNHDEWLAYDLSGEITINDTMRLVVPDGQLSRVHAFPYDRITVHSGDEAWIIPHQAGAAADPLKVGRELALKFQTNVITPHQHLSAYGWDKYDRYVVMSIGGLHDHSMFDYVQLRTTTMYNMNRGVAVIQNGEGILITPDQRQTNWKKYGGW